MYAGDEKLHRLIDDLEKVFPFGSKEDAFDGFTYCGWDVEQCAESFEIKISQEKYTGMIEPISFGIGRKAQRKEKADEKEIHMFRSVIGCLRWLADGTRPDLAFDASRLAGRISELNVQDLVDANKTLRRAKATAAEVFLKFSNEGNLDNLELHIFTDSAFQNMPDGKTQGGIFATMTTREGVDEEKWKKCSPISWTSKRIPRVVRSTLAGEVIMAGTGFDQGAYLRDMWFELYHYRKPQRSTATPDYTCKVLPIILWCDAKSVVEHCYSLTRLCAERRLVADFLVVQDAIESQEIAQIRHLPDAQNISDGLTKEKLPSFKNLATHVSKGDHPVDIVVVRTKSGEKEVTSDGQ